MGVRVIARSVQPDGDAIRGHRVELGLRAEDLAAAAKCSVRTISNAERGERVYPYFLKKIAAALEVPYSSLLADDGDAPPEPAAPLPRVEVRIVLGVQFGEFDQSTELVTLIERLVEVIGAKYVVEVKAVTPGSVVVTIELSEDDALRLLAAFKENGSLHPLRVIGVELPRGHGLETLDRFGRPTYRKPADEGRAANLPES